MWYVSKSTWSRWLYDWIYMMWVAMHMFQYLRNVGDYVYVSVSTCCRWVYDGFKIYMVWVAMCIFQNLHDVGGYVYVLVSTWCGWLYFFQNLHVSGYMCFRIYMLVAMCTFQNPHDVGVCMYVSVSVWCGLPCVCNFSINPSKSCGPFRLYSQGNYVSWVAVTDVIAGWPDWASKLFFFFGTTAFFVPCFILLWWDFVYAAGVCLSWQREGVNLVDLSVCFHQMSFFNCVQLFSSLSCITSKSLNPLFDLVLWFGRISDKVCWHILPHVQTASDGNLNVGEGHHWLARYNSLADTSTDEENAGLAAYYSQS